MNVKLLALKAIAASMYPELNADIAKGQAFEAGEVLAQKLVSDGVAEPEKAAEPAVKTVEVRLLVDVAGIGKANDVASIAQDRLKGLKGNGFVDDSKAAIAYAKQLAQNQPKKTAK